MNSTFWMARLLVVLFLVSLVPSRAIVSPGTFTPVYINTVVNGQAAPRGYYIFLPAAYYNNPTQKLPVLYFWHGAGEGGNGTTGTGTDGSPGLSNVLNAGVPNILKNSGTSTTPFDTNNCIVVCGQWTWGNGSSQWPVPNMRILMNFIMNGYGTHIDTRRIYITGLSYGCASTVAFLSTDPAPDDVAAAFACAWRAGAPDHPALFKWLPFWAFSAQGDGSPESTVDPIAAALAAPSVPAAVISNIPGGTITTGYTASFSPSTNTWKWVTPSSPGIDSTGVDPATGVNPKMTLFSGSDHNSWDRTYQNSNTWTWLFQQQKPDVTITSPATNLFSTHGAPITFTATATDMNGNPLTGSNIQWSSSIDGPIGTGTSITVSSLSYGTHDIRCEAVDDKFHGNHADITVTVPYTGSFTTKMNFEISGSPTPGGNWNTLVGTYQPGYGVGGSIADAVDYNTAIPVGVRLDITSPFPWYATDGIASTALFTSPVQTYGFTCPSGQGTASLSVSGLNPNQSYRFDIFGSTASSGFGTVTYTVGGSPVTMSIVGNTSNLATWTTVTPDANGRVAITVGPGSSGANESTLCALVISSAGAVPGQPTFTSNPPPATGAVNSPYSFTYVATGTPSPTFSVTSGSLPPGLTLDANSGFLSGTPTTQGTYTGSVTASNGVGTPAVQAFTISIGAPNSAASITSQPPPGGTVSLAYSFTYTASGSPVPTFSVTSGSLPPGLSLGTNGLLSGTPTATGTYTGVVTASNGVGSAGTQTFSIAIAAQAGSGPSYTVLMNLGGGHVIGHDTVNNLWWNDLLPATLYTNQTLINTASAATPLRFTVANTMILSGANTSSTTKGVTSPTGTVYSAAAAGNEDWAGNAHAFTLGGFDTSGATRYTLTFFSSYSGSGKTNFYALSGGATYSYQAGVTPVVNSSGNYNNTSSPTFEQYTFIPTTSTIVVTEQAIAGGFDLWGTLEITAQSTAPASPLQTFRTSAGLASDGSQDNAIPGHDGVPNIMKYAFNMTSNNYADIGTFNRQMLTLGGTQGLPLTLVDNGGHLTITFVQRLSSTNPGITYVPQVSNDMVTWTALSGQPTTTTPIDSNWQRVTYTDTATTSSTPRRYIRVQVTQP